MAALIRIVSAWWTLFVYQNVEGNPMSRPYIPFRTNPHDHEHLHHDLQWDNPVQQESDVSNYDLDSSGPDSRCPLQFSLGGSQRLHHATPRKGGLGIVEPPVIFPILPALGPGRQVLYTTQYEHLDMLTPLQAFPLGDSSTTSIIKEGLIQHAEFPLLFESSSFSASPILADINADGIIDIILADYHGGIYAIGSQASPSTGKRHFHAAQVPRLHVRRQWMESRVNETLGIDPSDGIANEDGEEAIAVSMNDNIPMDRESFRDPPHDPYHSYFEYSYGNTNGHEEILRGVTARVLGQDQEHLQGLEERRYRKIHLLPEELTASEPEGHFEDEQMVSEIEDEEDFEEEDFEANRSREAFGGGVDQHHRRLQEVGEDDAISAQNIQEKAVRDDGVKTNTFDIQDLASSDTEGVEKDAETLHPLAGLDWEAFVAKGSEGTGDSSIAQDGGTSEEAQTEKGFDNDDNVYGGDDVYKGYAGDDMYYYDTEASGGDDLLMNEEVVSTEGDEADLDSVYEDDDYPMYDDGYRRYDDYYGRYSSEQDEYYNDKHYVRIPPHVLGTPVAAELPKMYNQNGDTEMMLFVPVSYYLDEDEYEGFLSYTRFKDRDEGDETEVKRGMYVANAIMVYQFGDSPRWGRQEHLDLSADHTAPVNTTLVGSIALQVDNTKMGAFALGSPTIADIDGDGNLDMIMGTSMGIVYVMDARNLYSREGWPVQFPFGIESRILVEDVRGDTNLELFVADVGGTVACLNHKAEKLWHRHLLRSISTGADNGEILGASPMTLGDVNGDGRLDLVLVLHIRTPNQQEAKYLFVIQADTGKDLAHFPLQIGGVTSKDDGDDFIVEKLPAPLLVDLHSDQSWLEPYIRRDSFEFTASTSSHSSDKPPHGGSNAGLHIVFPVDSNILVVEGASGCTQTISIGEKILAMVQADDVHGTSNLDLVITTASGSVITLESPAPYHPLNVWNSGETRGRTNAFAHGYSASQGIFVHEPSREYRDIFGVYVPVTFEIFDHRPNIKNEPNRQVYLVEIRVGTSLPIFRKEYTEVGVYTERMYISYGPGYYQLTAVLKSTHGIVYEDTFHVGYNVNYMEGFALLLWLPLLLATLCILMCITRSDHWDDEDYDGDDRNGKQGILGGPLPE